MQNNNIASPDAYVPDPIVPNPGEEAVIDPTADPNPDPGVDPAKEEGAEAQEGEGQEEELSEDEKRLRALEAMADEETPEGQEDENEGQESGGPSLEDKVNWVISQIAKQAQEGTNTNTNDTPGQQEEDKEELTGYEAVYGAQTEQEGEQPQVVNDPRLEQILAKQKEQDEYIAYLYNENVGLKQRWEEEGAARRESEEDRRLREDFGADDDTIRRYKSLVSKGAHLDAAELLRGRTSADRAREQQLENRASERDLAGQDVSGGGSMSESIIKDTQSAPTAATLAAEYNKMVAQALDKNMGVVEFIGKYGNHARDYLNENLGGA